MLPICVYVPSFIYLQLYLLAASVHTSVVQLYVCKIMVSTDWIITTTTTKVFKLNISFCYLKEAPN